MQWERVERGPARWISLRAPCLELARSCSLQGLVPLLQVLAEQGMLARAEVAADDADQALVRFRAYLLAEWGLATCTAKAYVQSAHRFLTGLPGDRGLAGP